MFYQSSADLRPRLVLPHSLRSEALQSLHSDFSGSHLGSEKSLAKVKSLFFWPGLTTDVRTFVKACSECSARKSAVTSKSPLQSMQAGSPNQLVALDLVGPLPRTARGNQYILVCVDYFTRWPEAYALPNMTAETVAAVFVNNWICRYGVPCQLHSDQGTQFESDLFAEMCRLLNIRKTRTTPYHPQGDGLVERFNRTLVSTLRVHVKDHPQQWDRFLPQVLFSYRTAEHSSTHFTPAKLMFGHELRLPTELVFGLPPQSPFESHAMYVQQLSDALHSAFTKARSTDFVAHKKQKDYYDPKASC